MEANVQEQASASELERYESLMQQLDQSLKTVEDKNSNLADVIRAYEEGIAAHKQCVEILNRMEQKVIEIGKSKSI
ncbi:MAG: exodeoxyribonuclease VII small subunit [Bacillota bacterium]|nr:exodeoxyribonuclease VII small subunit [Bacillota bacterium]